MKESRRTIDDGEKDTPYVPRRAAEAFSARRVSDGEAGLRPGAESSDSQRQARTQQQEARRLRNRDVGLLCRRLRGCLLDQAVDGHVVDIPVGIDAVARGVPSQD